MSTPSLQREGKVTALEYREGKSSLITIAGVPYLTDMQFEQIDWQFGDVVTFELVANSPVPRAFNIKKKE